jgi:GT2 family glycosyltransferase
MAPSLFPMVYTVILNTNRREDTLECLRSLGRSDYPNNTILVLDNASSDGSVEAIHAEFPQVEILPLSQNLGYAGNNNVGIRRALERGADWVYILNEDTLVGPDCISLLVEAGEKDDAIGIIGPMVYHADEPGVIQSAGGMFDRFWQPYHAGANETDNGQFPVARDVEWICGCALLMRREAFEQVGVIDASFFYYNEEVELCFRAHRSGWRIQLVPTAKLWHKGVTRNYRPSANVTYYKVRNFHYFLSQHRAPLRVGLHAWMVDLGMVASYTLKPKWRHLHDHRDAAVHGMLDFLRNRSGKRV